MSQENPSAFPNEEYRNTSSDPLATPRLFKEPGMSLRDWFAGQAVVGCIHSFTGDGWHNPNEYQVKCFAVTAYRIADAMLAERSKP